MSAPILHTDDALIARGKQWFADQNWTAFPFQIEAWRAYLGGKSGILNAPTGSGKTYALMLPILLEYLRSAERPEAGSNGLRALWITPIRALTRDIQSAGQRAADDLGMRWRVAIRTGDTSSGERAKMKKTPPEVLITTPESLHLLLSGREHEKFFQHLQSIVVDEWHELVGTKRGVQIELALSRLKAFLPQLKVWGISATIGNMEEATNVLLGKTFPEEEKVLVKADIVKDIVVETVMPDEIERFPWAGHIGTKMLDKVLPIIHSGKSTLIFTNTRSQSEIWYQRLIEAAPDLIGLVAMHHGSISREIRDWVEESLHEGTLKAVVCTSSLDLGVDFRPVENIVQIGSPKGVSRFVQRAGRSGHRPGAKSIIHFVPTHSLELIEAAALRQAIADNELESRIPYLRSFDVLIQYLLTLACGGGFREEIIYEEIKKTYSYASVTRDEWLWCLDFITNGGSSLQAYDEYKKVGIHEGVYRMLNKNVATRHRLGIGTIANNPNLTVKYQRGGKIGNIEERFVSQFSPGDTFWFAGRPLKLVHVKGMTVTVKRSTAKTGKIPSWMGGRMSLSVQMSHELRFKVHQLATRELADPELQKIWPLAELQAERSHVPRRDELLVEYFVDREGFHLLFYPFEGRMVHEAMAALFGYRIARHLPITFSIALNDYGFELLSETEIPVDEIFNNGLFEMAGLSEDLNAGFNATEMAKRMFRNIASVAGLIFKGFPGQNKRDKHLQSSSQLFFDVFSEYEPDNLLLQQAYEEVSTFGLQEDRLRRALDRINQQTLVLQRPQRATPFAFPILVDRLRERMSSEQLKDRVERMKLALVS